MKQDNVLSFASPEAEMLTPQIALAELAREGARRMLQETLEYEVAEFLAQHRQGRKHRIPQQQCVTATYRRANW